MKLALSQGVVIAIICVVLAFFYKSLIKSIEELKTELKKKRVEIERLKKQRKKQKKEHLAEMNKKNKELLEKTREFVGRTQKQWDVNKNLKQELTTENLGRRIVELQLSEMSNRPNSP